MLGHAAISETAVSEVPVLVVSGWQVVQPWRLAKRPQRIAAFQSADLVARAPLVVSARIAADVPLPKRRLARADFAETIRPPARAVNGWPVEAPLRISKRHPKSANTEIITPARVAIDGWKATDPVIAPKRRVNATWMVWPEIAAQAAFSGWSSEHVAVIRVSSPVARATADPLPAQQVPPDFVGNAWVVAWDGPPAHQWPLRGAKLNAMADGAAAAAIPQGWQVAASGVALAVKARASESQTIAVEPIAPSGWQAEALVAADRKAAAADTPELIGGQAFTPYGWQVHVDMPHRPAKQTVTAAALGQEVVVEVPSGWSVVYPQLARPVTQPATQQAEARPATEASLGGVEFVWAIKPQLPRQPSTAVDLPVQKFAYAAPGDSDLWSFISYAFRTIRPTAAPPAGVTVKPAVRIASGPTLLGQSTAPRLLGASTAPSLLGQDANPALTGQSTAPNLLGASTAPALLGEV